MCFILIDWICMDIFFMHKFKHSTRSRTQAECLHEDVGWYFCLGTAEQNGSFRIIGAPDWTGLGSIHNKKLNSKRASKFVWPSSPLKHYLQNFTLNRSTLVNFHSKEKKNDFRWLNMNILNIRDEQSLTFSNKKIMLPFKCVFVRWITL